MAELAASEPDRIALVCEEGSWTRRDLDRRANQLARVYAAHGLGERDRATLMLPNGLEFFAACLAIWRLGAVPNPLSHRLPAPERRAIIERAQPALIIGVYTKDTKDTKDTKHTNNTNNTDEAEGIESIPEGFDPGQSVSTAPLPDLTSPNERAMASGGSTGLPKLIVAANPAVYDESFASALFKAKRAVLVPGPLYHAAPWSAAWQGLFAGCMVVVMRRFDARRTLELIATHRIDRMNLVPTMMQRIWRLPIEERESFDVSSLEFVMTGGAPCPAWLMRAWIDWLGPNVMHEAFGPSERIGGTFITGSEWLAHPGSVGKPVGGARIKILDEAGRPLPPGTMGEIYMMPERGPGSTYAYVGAEARVTEDGWESVGDMGYLDDEGYLYLGDRRSDMILSGGRNIYPAEIEAAIDSFPGVQSSAVIGLPDDDLGQAIHAILECEVEIDESAVLEHLAEHLAHYKVPRSLEFVRERLRDDAGKLRRSALRAARI
ncbi:MAG: AMP-binding protein [Deltaproteobacteria bacterium]|nr:AMP-binding protein [Deltaproteobacteria bacterium]